jgi:predicted  nucleic acid-binding Zn-ribbon protein
MSQKCKEVTKKCWKCGKIYKDEDAFDVCECEKCGCVMFEVLDADEEVKRCKGEREQISLFGG